MKHGLEPLLLHALPLDGSMWAAQMNLLPGSTYAPSLYSVGNRIEDWTEAALSFAKSDRIIVAGCSVGGSCALEIAARAPERVAALVLIGTKAELRPDPGLHAEALEVIRNHGLESAWERYWKHLLSPAAASSVSVEARNIALRQTREDVAAGVTAFHTRPSRGHVLTDAPFPVISISGADDKAPGPKTMASQAVLAKHGQIHIIPDCGHYVPMERPDALNAILRDAIAGVSHPHFDRCL